MRHDRIVIAVLHHFTVRHNTQYKHMVHIVYLIFLLLLQRQVLGSQLQANKHEHKLSEVINIYVGIKRMQT